MAAGLPTSADLGLPASASTLGAALHWLWRRGHHRDAAGTTGAVVGTLDGVAGKVTYLCGFNVSTIGGTASSAPVTVAGLVGSSQVYQRPVNATAGQILISQNFNPCIPASAANTAITVTTTAAAGATAVDVNSWGYQQ
jgi:hypothetical protein